MLSGSCDWCIWIHRFIHRESTARRKLESSWNSAKFAEWRNCQTIEGLSSGCQTSTGTCWSWPSQRRLLERVSHLSLSLSLSQLDIKFTFSSSFTLPLPFLFTFPCSFITFLFTHQFYHNWLGNIFPPLTIILCLLLFSCFMCIATAFTRSSPFTLSLSLSLVCVQSSLSFRLLSSLPLHSSF